jgi:hypothetical protein
MHCLQLKRKGNYEQFFIKLLRWYDIFVSFV